MRFLSKSNEIFGGSEENQYLCAGKLNFIFMRKSFISVVLAIVAVATMSCKKGEYPANIQGTWQYNDTTANVQSVLSTSSSSASKGIPATIDFVSQTQEYSTKVLIDYDPEDGEGTFKPEKDSEGLTGSFDAIDKLNIKLTLIYVNNKGESTTLLNKAIYTYKQDSNNN